MLFLSRVTRTLIRTFCLIVIFSFTINVVVAQDAILEVDRQYIEPVKLELTAAPGESLSKNINVPVKVTLSDGTEYIEYETVTLSLSNVVAGADLADFLGTTAVNFKPFNPLTSLTYLYCQGSLNGSTGDYTSRVDWHYDGSTAWHDSNSVVTWNANSPWSKYRYYAAAGAPGSNVTVSTAVSFKKGTIFPSYKTHQITWTLQGSGSCSATGTIYNGTPGW